jgi:DNA mismatch endonuclease Vsr
MSRIVDRLPFFEVPTQVISPSGPILVRRKGKSLAAKARRKAGHRSWAAENAPVPGAHRGDIMSAQKRSELMSRIKGKNTATEQLVFAELRHGGIYFAKHAKDLPGRPDIVFRRIKLAVFIDGDFWHGWRLPSHADIIRAGFPDFEGTQPWHRIVVGPGWDRQRCLPVSKSPCPAVRA